MNSGTIFKEDGSPLAGAPGQGIWPRHLLMLALAWVAALAIHFRDVIDIVGIWWTSSTFAHCLFIPLIVSWLTAQRWGEVKNTQPVTWLPGVAFVAVASLIWLLGAAAGLGQLRHIGLILTLQSMVLSLLGPNVTRALLFPLFYMSFMVPAGEELVPLLQTITAEICMGMLGIFGIPASINGIFITIPNGYFEVAEACSGVKFLVAMIAYGALVANVCFTSWSRRILFLTAAIALPILANGLRAFATIYYAHATNDIESAAGFDHVFYGWFFFAFVIILLMAASWRFFDRKPQDPWLNGFAEWPWPKGTNSRLVEISGLAMLAAPVFWLAITSTIGREPIQRAIALPEVANWRRVQAIEPGWNANFSGADHRLIGHYRNAAGLTVDVSIALYGWQDEGRELVGFGQGAVMPDGIWTWAANTKAPLDGKAERLVTRGPINREAATFYVTHDGMTGSASAVKLSTLKARLMGNDQAAGALIVSALDLPGTPGRVAIDAFLKDMGSPEAVVRQLIKQAKGV